MTDTSEKPTVVVFTNAVALKLPEFWPSDRELWFAQAEALFAAQNVRQEKTKFGHVVRVLPARYASEVRDVIPRLPEEPYTALKIELQKRVCPSKRQRLQQLLNVEDICDKKPSQLLRHMLKLRGDSAEDAYKDEIFRELYFQKLPLPVRTALAIYKESTLSHLADLADHMVEVQGPSAPICEVQKQDDPAIAAVHLEIQKIWRASKSPRRTDCEEQQSSPASDVCCYHERFGSKAKKCREPCQFQRQSGK